MRKLFFALVMGGLGAGCTLVNQVQSHIVMISQVTVTPDETVGGQHVAGKTLATVFLGERDPLQLQSPPKGITGAQVELQFNGQTVALADKGGGNYLAESSSSPALTYVAGTSYRFVATHDGETFAEKVDAPDRERIVEFHTGALADDGGLALPDLDGGLPDLDGGFAKLGFLVVQPGQDLTLNRETAGGDLNEAITLVTPVTSGGPQQPSYSNPSTSPLDLINFVINPGAFQKPTITIPGSEAWPACPPSDFLLTVTVVKKGETEGDNLFLGSAALAGSSDAAPAHCQ